MRLGLPILLFPIGSFLTSFLFGEPRALAEYRAYLLQIQTKEGQILKEFASTLDPDQYRGFHSISPDLRLNYTRTWMCRGRTQMEPICAAPVLENPSESRSPSSDQKAASPP